MDEIREEQEEQQPQFSRDNLPKSKEEWAEFAKQDPMGFYEITQERTDQMFRENRELKEKVTQFENLRLETTPQPLPDEDFGEYSYRKMPKTKEEWDNLAIEDPILCQDLRSHYNRLKETEKDSFLSAQANSRKVVQVEHSDMYLQELDENGNPKRDDKGNIILKLDPYSKEPIFNPDSEKGKLWIEEYSKDPGIEKLKDAPEILMGKMERRLRERGKKMVEENKVEPKQNQVAPEGVTPPKPEKLSFSSDSERAHAEKAVARGTYRNLEEYCKLRDEGSTGLYDENRTPDFSKK